MMNGSWQHRYMQVKEAMAEAHRTGEREAETRQIAA